MLVKSLWSSAIHSRPTYTFRQPLKFNLCVRQRSRSFSFTTFNFSRLKFSTLPAHTPPRISFESSANTRFFSANAPTAPLPVLPPPSVGCWLLFSSALVFAVIVVGGVTRLTESGLSITEWRPITGILPPLSNTEWQEEFNKYKATPEFKM